MSDNISYNSFRLSAECPFFCHRRIGTFVRGGEFDSDYFYRNKNHLSSVVEWLIETFSGICSNSVVSFYSISWDDANELFQICFSVSSPVGDFVFKTFVFKED